MQGSTLRFMRLEIGWTQKIMAEVLGITRSSLTHYENERAQVPPLIICRIKILHRGVLRTIEKSRGERFG